jgi:hypothetical protein
MTQNWTSICEWVTDITVITLLPTSLLYAAFKIKGVLKQLSLMTITPDVIVKAKKLARYSFLNVAASLDIRHLEYQLLTSHLHAARSYLAALVISFLPIYASLSLLLFMDLLILGWLVALRPCVFTTVNYLHIAILVSEVVYEAL